MAVIFLGLLAAPKELEMKTKDQEQLDKMLRIKAEKERPGNTIPDCFEYEGKVLDTSTVIDWLCKRYERQVAQSGSTK